MAKAKRVAGKASSDASESKPAAAAATAEKPSIKKRAKRRTRVAAKVAGNKTVRRRRRRSASSTSDPTTRTASSRRRFTPAERARILAAANREGLTGAKAAKRFGISQVTYYLWRKNARPAIREAAQAVRKSGVIDLADEIREQLRDQIRRMVPDVVRKEIDSAVADISGGRRRGRRA
jgi:transposase-like protein